MFDQLTEIIVNYVEVKKEDIKPESSIKRDSIKQENNCWMKSRKAL